MKKKITLSPRILTCMMAGLLLSGTTIAAQSASSCSVLTGCERKICEKEFELEKAKEYGDVSKILGLQNSLVHVKDSCAQNPNLTSAEYQADLKELREEYKEDLDDALDEYEDDLAEAKAEGKADKVARAKEKYEQKVQKVTDEYQRKLQLMQVVE
ncbi:DUF1090 domain-containing protein [Vibrio fluvialis]|nr:DUF1090 domain-containing protein [Vibrio fluvialis]